MLENWGWWLGFNVFVLAMLALDLGVFHRKAHEVHVKEALIWSGVWIALALAFNVLVYFSRGQEVALQFLTGYVIEKTLSIDNVFVFLLIFTSFRIPAIHQHKILFWGILGALVMRALFIALGITLIEKFHWMIYVFGAILVITGIRIAMEKDKEIHPENNPLLKLLKRVMPVSESLDTGKFFVRKAGKLMATPLFVALLIVETTDVIFAVDSIPAILAITSDPFIVYTSNVFAILGLRALYFALSGIMRYFHHLHYGLAAILVFVGVKMLISHVFHVPVGVSLAFIAVAIVISIAASLLWPKRSAGPEITHGA
jgi:tellurite resistance protein TerC